MQNNFCNNENEKTVDHLAWKSYIIDEMIAKNFLDWWYALKYSEIDMEIILANAFIMRVLSCWDRQNGMVFFLVSGNYSVSIWRKRMAGWRWYANRMNDISNTEIMQRLKFQDALSETLEQMFPFKGAISFCELLSGIISGIFETNPIVCKTGPKMFD